MRSQLPRRRLLSGVAAGAAAATLSGRGPVATAETGSATNNLVELAQELRAVWPNNRTVNIVWHGHSVPAGYHRTPEVRPFDSYPHMTWQGLNSRFPTAVINSITTAIGGENAVSGARRFDTDVLPHRPDLVFIDYAINDRALPLDDVRRAWRSMIDAARRHRIPLILITPTGTRFNDLDDPADALAVRAELIRTLAADRGRFQDLWLADVSRAWQQALKAGVDQESLLSQGVHPNAAGHTIAATCLIELMTTLTA